MYRRFFLLLAASAGLLAFVLLRDSEPAPTAGDVPPSQVVATPVLPQPGPPPVVPPQSELPTAAPAVADDAQFAGLEVWLGRLKAAATAQAHLEILQQAAARESAARFLHLIARILRTGHEEVRVRCFNALLQETSKQVIPALIHALGSGNPAISSEAARQLEARLGPSAPVFKQSGAAKAWWDENAHRYGDDLRRLD